MELKYVFIVIFVYIAVNRPLICDFVKPYSNLLESSAIVFIIY